MALFIIVSSYVIQCLNSLGCSIVPYEPVRAMILAGVLELSIEISGIIKIYRRVKGRGK